MARVRKFNPDWFRANYAGKHLRLRGRDWTLGEILDVLEHSTASAARSVSVQVRNRARFPGTAAEVTPRFAYSLPDRQANPLIPAVCSPA